MKLIYDRNQDHYPWVALVYASNLGLAFLLRSILISKYRPLSLLVLVTAWLFPLAFPDLGIGANYILTSVCVGFSLKFTVAVVTQKDLDSALLFFLRYCTFTVLREQDGRPLRGQPKILLRDPLRMLALHLSGIFLHLTVLANSVGVIPALHLPFIGQALQALFIYQVLCVSLHGNRLVPALLGYETKPPMINPLFASQSFRELWGRRWNMVVSDVLRKTCFDQCKSPLAGSMAAFTFSALFHEWMVIVPTRFLPDIQHGLYFRFFAFHFIMCSVESVAPRCVRDVVRPLPGLLKTFWVSIFCTWLCGHWFTNSMWQSGIYHDILNWPHLQF